jgi:hypothetical protein
MNDQVSWRLLEYSFKSGDNIIWILFCIKNFIYALSCPAWSLVHKTFFSWQHRTGILFGNTSSLGNILKCKNKLLNTFHNSPLHTTLLLSMEQNTHVCSAQNGPGICWYTIMELLFCSRISYQDFCSVKMCSRISYQDFCSVKMYIN